jgi:hypothetical protein
MKCKGISFFSASPLALAGYPPVWTDNTCVLGVLVIKTQKWELFVSVAGTKEACVVVVVTSYYIRACRPLCVGFWWFR